jgi:hypothetical protein
MKKRILLLTIICAFLPLALLRAQPAEVGIAIDALNAQLGTAITLRDLDEWTWDQEQFNDASLGCPQPGQMYAQVISVGYIITLSYGGVIYDFRIDQGGNAFLCSMSGAPLTALPPTPTATPVFPTGEVITPRNADAVAEIGRVVEAPGTFGTALTWFADSGMIAVVAGIDPDNPDLTGGGILLVDADNLGAAPQRIELNSAVTALTSAVFEGRPYLIFGTQFGEVALLGLNPTDPEPRLMQTDGTNGPITSVAVSPDFGYVAAGFDAQAQTWDLATGAPLRTLPHGDVVGAVAFSPDLRYLATGAADGAVRLWDVREGVLMQQFAAHNAPVLALAFSFDGRLLASGGLERFTRIWSVATGGLVGELDNATDDHVYALTFSPDAQVLATTGGNPSAFTRDNSIRLWDVAGLRVRGGLLGHDTPVTDVAFSPDGTRIVTVSEDGSLRLWGAADDAAG